MKEEMLYTHLAMPSILQHGAVGRVRGNDVGQDLKDELLL